jgi:hypothetical protein
MKTIWPRTAGLAVALVMLWAGTALADPSRIVNGLGYKLGMSLADFQAQRIPFAGLPAGAEIKCGNDPTLKYRMVGYVSLSEARYQELGLKTCRIVVPDPVNSRWWRPAQIDIAGVRSNLRFIFMPETASRGADEKSFILVGIRTNPVHPKEGYQLLGQLTRQIGQPRYQHDRVELAPGIVRTMRVHTWQSGPIFIAAWDPSELGNYELVFSLTAERPALQQRLAGFVP